MAHIHFSNAQTHIHYSFHTVIRMKHYTIAYIITHCMEIVWNFAHITELLPLDEKTNVCATLIYSGEASRVTLF